MTKPFTDPEHYKGKKFSPWDVIDVFFIHAYHLGAAFKYMARAGKKLYDGFDALNSELIDIGKAIKELERHKTILEERIRTENKEGSTL